MVYSDLFFILGLLPIAVIVSFFDRSTEYKNLILILTSAIFFTWGKPLIILLLFTTCILDYIFGLLCGRLIGKRKVGATIFLMCDMLMNIAIFLVFGRNYLFDSIEKLSFSDLVIPVGIAFYTVRAFSYVYDVYTQKIKAEKNIFCLLTYMISFHFMICGPIVRYGDVEPAIRHRTINGEYLNKGINKLVTGLAKVVLVGYALNQLKLVGLNGNEITFFGCWFGMIAFFGEIYFCFTGMTDMAKGIGYMNGFDYKDNFDEVSSEGLFTGLVKGFNKSLNGFFEEVICSPFKDKKVLYYISIAVCTICVAMWYSFGKRFILAGVLVAVVILAEKLFLAKKLEKSSVAVKYIYMFLLSVFIFGTLYFKSVYGYRKWALALVGVGTDYAMSVAVEKIVIANFFIFVVGIISCIPSIKNKIFSFVDKYAEKSAKCYGQVEILKTIIRALLFVMCVCSLVVRNAG